MITSQTEGNGLNRFLTAADGEVIVILPGRLLSSAVIVSTKLPYDLDADGLCAFYRKGFLSARGLRASAAEISGSTANENMRLTLRWVTNR